MSGELVALGVDQAAERLYRRILHTVPASLADHAAGLGWDAEQGRAAYDVLVRTGLVAAGTTAVLTPESPRAAIGRLVEQEAARLEARRRELEAAEALIVGFARVHRSRPREDNRTLPTLEIVAPEALSAAFEQAVRATSGLIRHVMTSTETIGSRDEGLVRWIQGQVAQGRELRSIYPTTFLEPGQAHAARWVRDWAEAGEEQRLLESVPHAFTVFGQELVLACSTWGVVTDDMVAIRSPMLVQSFTALFDEAWRVGLPVPRSPYETVPGDRMLSMLAAGLKDEAIARFLGVSLRTVRRRVALLMEECGAQTRFQLGSAAERRGLLRSDPA